MSVDPDSDIHTVKEEKIFLLGIDHGKQVTKDSYAYLLLPRTTLEKTLAAAEENPLQIVENSSVCQAIWDPARGLGMAVCYQPTSVTFGGQTIAVDKECTLLYRNFGDHWTLQVADPLHREVEISVTLTGDHAAELVYAFVPGYRSANLGRPLCYDSRQGFLPLTGAKTDALTAE